MFRYASPAYAGVRAILVFLALSCGLGGCLSTIELPVITRDAGHLQLTGKFVWFDLYTPNMDVSRQFYEHVLGWSLERTDQDSPRVKNIMAGSMRIGNIFLLEAGKGTSRWVSCLSVPDVDTAFAQAVESGATPLAQPDNRPFRGRMAVLRDPAGAEVALLASAVGDPRDMPPSNGYWLGAELWTPDPEGVLPLYGALAGYAESSLPLRDGGRHTLLVGYGRPRAAVRSMPLEGVATQWVPQVAVLDIEAALTAVEAHGGKVLIPPRAADKPSRVAVFADPFGAVLGLREYLPPED